MKRFLNLQSIKKHIKFIFLIVLVFFISGIANFYAKPDNFPYRNIAPSDFSISSKNLNIHINKDGLIHSLVVKNQINSYSNKPEVLLNDPMNNQSCIELGFKGDGFPDNTTQWTLVKQEDNNIILSGKGTKHNIIREISVIDMKILIKDKILNYDGMSQRYVNINGSGNGKGKFVFLANNSLKSFANLSHHSGILNLYKKNKYKSINVLKKDSFGFQDDSNFFVLVKSNPDSINYYSDKTGNHLYSLNLTNDILDVEISVVPNVYSHLKAEGFQNFKAFGFFGFIVKPLSIFFDFFMSKFQNVYGFVSFIFLLSLISFPLFFWAEKRKKESKNLELKILQKNKDNLNPQAIMLQMVGFQLKTFAIIFVSNIVIFYSFFRNILGESFLLKNINFLWIQDFSTHDIGGIFNLYGLLPIDLPDIIKYFGVFQIVFLSCFYLFNLKDMKANNLIDKNQNNYFIVFFILIILTIYTSIGQMLGYSLFLVFREILLKLTNFIIKKHFHKSDLEYEQI